MRTAILTAALVAAATSAGCGRAHLNRNQGISYRRAFASQQVMPATQSRAPSTALDTQEADVISKTYVHSLAGKARTETPEPVLYVAPAQRGPASQLPPPSVPRN